MTSYDFHCLPSASHLCAWLLSALLRSTCVRAPCLRSRSSAPSFFSLSGDFLSLQRYRQLSVYLHRSDRLYRLFWIYWLLCASPRSTRSRNFLINFFFRSFGAPPPTPTSTATVGFRGIACSNWGEYTAKLLHTIVPCFKQCNFTTQLFKYPRIESSHHVASM